MIRLLILLVIMERSIAFTGPFRKMFPEISEPATPLHTNDTGEPLFLSPLLAKGQWKLAQQLAKVNGGTFGKAVANVESYSGYLTVNSPDCKSNLFFWYFPAMVSILFGLFWGAFSQFNVLIAYSTIRLLLLFCYGCKEDLEVQVYLAFLMSTDPFKC